jgi:hypothetical protein
MFFSSLILDSLGSDVILLLFLPFGSILDKVANIRNHPRILRNPKGSEDLVKYFEPIQHPNRVILAVKTRRLFSDRSPS